MTATVRLCPESVKEIAHCIVELLQGESIGGELIDTAEVARRLGVSRAFVYQHAAELGAIRLSDSPKAHLRFDPATLRERLNPSPRRSMETPQPPNRRLVRNARSTNLLPIKGESP